jgi:hypothetical protein
MNQSQSPINSSRLPSISAGQRDKEEPTLATLIVGPRDGKLSELKIPTLSVTSTSLPPVSTYNDYGKELVSHESSQVSVQSSSLPMISVNSRPPSHNVTSSSKSVNMSASMPQITKPPQHTQAVEMPDVQSSRAKSRKKEKRASRSPIPVWY